MTAGSARAVVFGSVWGGEAIEGVDRQMLFLPRTHVCCQQKSAHQLARCKLWHWGAWGCGGITSVGLKQPMPLCIAQWTEQTTANKLFSPRPTPTSTSPALPSLSCQQLQAVSAVMPCKKAVSVATHLPV
eukprot:354423-Chlamydomonas_euryale.AAC.9